MLESPLVVLGRLPGTVRLLVAGSLINKVGSFIVPYLTLVLRREFRLSDAQVGLLMLAFGCGSVVSILAGGHLTDRLGRRRTLLACLFGSGAIAIALGLSPSVRVFVPLLVLFGFLSDLYRPAASAIISDTLPSPQRVIGFAALRMSVNLGFAVGMALGGVLADLDWRLLFFGDGATTLLYGVVVYFFIPETRPLPDAAAIEAAPALSPWRDGVFLQAAFASLTFSLVFFVDFSVLPLTITLSAGYPAVVYGCLVGLNGLLIAVFEVTVVDWLRRFRRLRVASLGMLITGIGMAMVGQVMHWAWFLLTVLIWTAGEILTAPQQTAFVADWAPPASRGRYMAVFQATWSLALAVGPLIFLPIYSRLGERLFWPLMFVLALPGALMLARLDRIADHPERLRGLTRTEPPTPLLPVVSTEG